MKNTNSPACADKSEGGAGGTGGGGGCERRGWGGWVAWVGRLGRVGRWGGSRVGRGRVTGWVAGVGRQLLGELQNEYGMRGAINSADLDCYLLQIDTPGMSKYGK